MINKIVLASASPRRVEILRQLGIEPEVFPVEVEEVNQGEPPRAIVEYNAKLKAEAAAALRPDSTIVAADTIVAKNQRILGKPKTAAEAMEVLRFLSGRTHSVFSCVAVIYEGKLCCETVETLVKFNLLSDEEIADYVATKEPMDKAGAYGIQGKGALFVSEITGDYNNVVGLPVAALNRLLPLKKFTNW